MKYIKPNPEPKRGANFLFEYEGCPKISLSRGKEAFEECITLLKSSKELPPLILCDKLKVEVPENFTHWVKKDIVKDLIAQKKEETKNKYNVHQFHYDIGGLNPFISAILQITDDNLTFNCTRRNNILDPDFDSVGLDHFTLGKKMCIYCLFGKKISVF